MGGERGCACERCMAANAASVIQAMSPPRRGWGLGEAGRHDAAQETAQAMSSGLCHSSQGEFATRLCCAARPRGAPRGRAPGAGAGCGEPSEKKATGSLCGGAQHPTQVVSDPHNLCEGHTSCEGR